MSPVTFGVTPGARRNQVVHDVVTEPAPRFHTEQIYDQGRARAVEVWDDEKDPQPSCEGCAALFLGSRLDPRAVASLESSSFGTEGIGWSPTDAAKRSAKAAGMLGFHYSNALLADGDISSAPGISCDQERLAAYKMGNAVYGLDHRTEHDATEGRHRAQG